MMDAKDSDLVNGLLALAGSDDLDHFVAMQIKHAAERLRAKDDIIERQSKALDAAMMVVWWVVGEGIVPSDYDIDPDQVMLDNVADIIGDNGEHWEQMFQALSQ